ncbi:MULTISPECIES: hypothetical protein [Flavobacteriaceae]|jgi:hypothetical protein|uniref:Zinc ribbon domain-containing protein n=2 Tax=Flavobacteriaceae TaxID=49546 RepID=A0ABP3UNK5_9FLAO|nr:MULTISPECIES: hypothetical protein [Flavobacteriaceae]TDY13495.1 hypothetical protein A8975_0085 [Meridianimaribacter flavus]
MTDLNCPNCKETVSQIEFECSNCGYPLSGTEKEKAIFIGKQITNKTKIGDAKDSQNRVQKILYIIAAFQFLNAFLVYRKLYSIEDVIFYCVLGIILIIFGYLCPKKPILFISLSLALILGYYLLLYLNDPMYLYSGILWKIVIVASLLYGLALSFDEQKLKKKYNYLKDK